MIADLDAEIAHLQDAREALAAVVGESKPRSAGRPKNPRNVEAKSTKKKAAKNVARKMSSEGRQRIAEAQEKRWDAAKKAA